MDVTEIEKRVDRAIAAPIEVSADIGGVVLENMGQVMEFAKLMAVSGSAVPKYLRGNPGGCLAICSRALRWGMDPFAVAEKSYQVVNKGEERIAYEAQLVHAVITARAPLFRRLRHEITGEGDERRCRVWGTFRGEDKPHEYISETLAKLRDARGRNEYGNIKGSPLWDTVPEVQLAYSTYRQWCRLFASEVLLGVYTPDELEDGTEKAVDVKLTGLQQRLADMKAARQDSRGFDAEHVNREASARSTIIEGEVTTDTAKPEDTKDERRDESNREGQQGGTAGGDMRDPEQGGGQPDDRSADQIRSQPAGHEAAQQQPQQQVFFKDESAKAKPKDKPKGKR